MQHSRCTCVLYLSEVCVLFHCTAIFATHVAGEAINDHHSAVRRCVPGYTYRTFKPGRNATVGTLVTTTRTFTVDREISTCCRFVCTVYFNFVTV